MTTFVLATDHVDASAVLCDYLFGHLGDGDAVHAVNSLVGGDETTSRDVRDVHESTALVSQPAREAFW